MNNSYYMNNRARTIKAIVVFILIFALLAGKFFGLVFLDPLVGIIGGVMICLWAYNLIKSTSIILLDVKNK